jgi:hypothetical protein
MFFISAEGKDCTIEGMLQRYVVLGWVTSIEWEQPIMNINRMTEEYFFRVDTCIRLLAESLTKESIP